MRYNLEGFNQQKLVEMKLNSNDAIILRWFVDFYATIKMSVVKDKFGQEFKWVKYQAVIDDLPILEIKNKQVIARHFEKMVKCGILEKYLHKQEGTYSCFRLTEKYRVLIEKLNPIDSKVDTPIDSKVDTKDSSININDSIKIPITDKKNNIEYDKTVLLIGNYFWDKFDKPSRLNNLEQIPKNWLKPIDKLLNIDKVDSDIIFNVINYALKDKYWKPIISSTQQLEKHFNTLELQSKTPKKKEVEWQELEKYK